MAMGGGGESEFGRLLIPGACLLITLGFLGYAISSGRKGAVAVQRAPVTAQNAPAASPVPVAPSKPAASPPKSTLPVQQTPATAQDAPAASPPKGALPVQRAPETAQNAPAASPVPVAPSGPAASPPSPSIPARLALSNENGLIGYSGTVGNDATRTAIIDSLKSVFGADKITGDLAVDQHVGQAGWAKDLKLALDDFKTPGSQALFEGNTIRVGGTIPDADRDRIIGSVKSDLGPRFEAASLAGSGAAKTAAAQVAPSPGVSGEHPDGASNQLALRLPAIYFASYSDRVPSSSKALLRQEAGRIKQMPAGTVVQISGYTDPAGDPTANVKLSQRRAYAVRDVLVEAGVDPAMLSAKGYGASLAGNETTEGRSNRRVKNSIREDRRVELRIVQQ
ncbi:MAG: OmpA family protein [Beijerinckiaceae bacterium]